MSASIPPPGPPSGSPTDPNAAADPSMEDILASIRRILSEDEQVPGAATGDAKASAPDVITLDESMLVEEPEPQPTPAPVVSRAADDDMARLIASMSAPAEPLEIETLPPPVAAPPASPPMDRADRLIAPEAEAATTSSVTSLLRTLEAGREQAPTLPVYRGGPTLEDMVRDEMRPLLKTWLDSNLPPMVERLVRAEIERLVGRAVS